MASIDGFLRARDQLIALRTDYDAAVREFRWPALSRFNWALDYFDPYAAGNAKTALWIVDDQGGESRSTFAELSERSTSVARFLQDRGARRGEHLLLMLPNVSPLWEAILACMKLGLVIIPSTTLLSVEDLRDRFDRGNVRHVITDAAGAAKLDAIPGGHTRIVVHGTHPRWISYDDAVSAPREMLSQGESSASDPLLMYFTSGTTARPKMVLHSHQSYPVGHLSTMYWIGLRAGDMHLNISSPGWAKHAWSSVFAPWNAGAAVFVYNYARFDARGMLATIARYPVTTLCASPTVWRMLVGEDLASVRVTVREAVSAGEPLNAEVIDRVRRAWGVTIRDGYGQTETTALVGNAPGQLVKDGAMGRPLPGYRVVLLDPDGSEADEGEIAIVLEPRPLGLMAGYLDNQGRTTAAVDGAYYRTGDIARRDGDGYITYVGRSDDVFKSSDYRISPFELESVLVEHARVAEAAVVPSPDPVRLCVPKAYVVPRNAAPSRELALDIFRFVRTRVAPFKRVRRLQFAELPKTISGKIRRVELRAVEEARADVASRAEHEYWEDDFPELRREGPTS
jgi:acetyl-CoA synthetase